MLNVMRNSFFLIVGISLAVLHLLLGTPIAKAGLLKDLSNKQLRLTENDFLIHESGYWTCEGTLTRCLYWLDDERVIFNGSKPDDIELIDGRRVWRHAIYVWDLKSGKVTKYAESAKATLCYADGHIRYSRVEGDDVVVISGPIGKETETRRIRRGVSHKAKPEDWGWNTELSCDNYRPQPPYPLIGRKIALKRRHGFLYLGTNTLPAEKRRPVTYFQHESKHEITLPVQRWELNSSEIKATDFNDSYLITPTAQIFDKSDRCVPKNFSRHIYRFTTDGRVETVQLPPHDAIRCYVEIRGFTEVRAGITVRVNTGRLRTSGLHLIQGRRITLVLRGWTSDSAVSPNGCRMALGVSSPDDQRKPITAEFNRGHLKIVDFCSKEAR